MANKPELFADGIDQIRFINGMLRYDFATFRTETGKAEREVAFRVIMPPQGFLSTLNAMNAISAKLLEAGVFRRVEELPETVAEPAPAAPAKPGRGRPVGSKTAAKPGRPAAKTKRK